MLRRAPSQRTLRVAAAAAFVLVVVGLLAIDLPASYETHRAASDRWSIAAGIPPWNNWTCNPNDPSPAALDIPNTNPSLSEPAGAMFTIGYEYRVLNHSSTLSGARLVLPQAKAVLPERPSGSLSLTVAARTVSLTGSTWSSASLLSGTSKLSKAANFSSGTAASLSTEKLAVMVDRPSGSVTVEFRWRWSFADAGIVRTGSWSVPRSTASAPFLPSIFFPAPFVGLPSTSASPAGGGSQFNLTLNGTVASTSFRVVLEYPSNGTEIQSIWENSSRGASHFNATVPLAFKGGKPVPAGRYLIHVHDICEAIVRLVQVTGGSAHSPILGMGSLQLAASRWQTLR